MFIAALAAAVRWQAHLDSKMTLVIIYLNNKFIRELESAYSK